MLALSHNGLGRIAPWYAQKFSARVGVTDEPRGCCDGGNVPDDCCGFGLGVDGRMLAAATTETVAERVRRIREKMIIIGIPAAIGSGLVTMFTFAGAFGLARTERVWTPSIWLGAVTTIGALIGLATAAKTVQDVATTEAASTPAPAPEPTQPTPAAFY